MPSTSISPDYDVKVKKTGSDPKKSGLYRDALSDATAPVAINLVHAAIEVYKNFPTAAAMKVSHFIHI
jgi:hypothetical protein